MATDISDEALSQARQARYREWSLRGDGAALARGFLQAQDDRLVLHRAIVESVEFDHLNLAEDVYPSVRTGTIGLDLITCRNVLIYFDRKTVSEVARRLYDSLAPGGWLIAASGDPSLSELAAFESVITDDGIYYRRPLVESSKVRRDQTFVPLSSTIGQNSQDSQAHSNSLVEEFLHRDQSVNDADDGESELPQTSFEEALESGRYEDVIKATSENLDDAATCVAHVRALAKIDPESAVHRCGDLLVRHPLSHELQYVHSLLLLDLRQDEEAAEAAQRAVYLNPGSAPAHFLLGAIEQKRGFVDAARRHFRNTRNICSLRDGDEVLDLTGSGTAAELSAAATARLKVLDPLS